MPPKKRPLEVVTSRINIAQDEGPTNAKVFILNLHANV